MNKNLKKVNAATTMLTISMGFLVIYMASDMRWALWVSLVIGIIGILSKWASEKVSWLWMKLAWLLGMVVPNILLSAVFFLFLTPIAFLAKIFSKKDSLKLSEKYTSTYVDEHKTFEKASFEKPW